MKKMMIALVAMLMVAASGKAMSYEQARNEALFLTDKMAYELNLTDEQYEAAYEINLDYLMGVTSYDDVYATYWERRNLDMSYVLLDWQWSAFCAAAYFYRPLYWEGGYWHFGIYARYPHRDYFFFGRPVFYASYRGGHAWHCVGGRGYYYEHRVYFHSSGRSHFGMLDRWNRGDYRHCHSGRLSSTRTTVNNRSLGNRRSYESDRNFGKRSYTASEARYHERYSGSPSYGSRSNGSSYRSGRNSSSYGSRSNGSSYSGRSNGYNRNSGSTYNGRNYSSSASFGGRSTSSSSSSFGRSSSYSGRSSGSSYGGSHSSSSFSSGRSSGSSYGGSRSSSSFSSGRSSGSFSSGGSRSSGGSSSSGGRSFGGHR